MSLKKLKIRKTLKDFIPYEWEVSSKEIAKKIKIKEKDIIRFDTNTSPKLPKKWLEILFSNLKNIKLNEYPDTSYLTLRKLISRYLDLNPNNINITNGADEGLDILAKTFIDKGDLNVISSPTYTYYKSVIQIAGGKIIEIPRKVNFEDDDEEIIRTGKRNNVRLFFLCRPNNPTGNSIRKETVLQLLEETDSIIVIDEAYNEFTKNNDSLVKLIKIYDNLVIVRTFSKAFSLAGARVGYLVGSDRIIKLINMVRPPNSLSVISLKLAEIALNDLNIVKENIDFIVKERERCEKKLKEINGIRTYPSETNFLLIKIDNLDYEYVFQELMRKGLVVRNVGRTRGLEKCLRFSVQDHAENTRLIEALYSIFDNKNL